MLLHFVIPFNLICNMMSIIKTSILTYWPHPHGWGGGGGSAGMIFATILLHFIIPFNLICSMTMFCKNWILIPPQGLWKKAGKGVCGQNICCHFAAFLFHMYHNLICNMTMFCKSWTLTFWPNPIRLPRVSDPGLCSKITLDMFLIYCTIVYMLNFSKNVLTTDWVIVKF